MIRASFTVSAEADDGLQRFDQFLKDFDNVVGELANESFADIRSPFINELQAEPGAVKYPIAWTSEKQRRAFFATDGFGRGIPTRRTRRMVNAWDVRLVKRDNAYVLIASNNVPYTRFVVGSVRMRNPTAEMQRFHRNTGWHPVNETVTFWFNEFNSDFATRFDRYLVGFGIFRTQRRNR